MVYGGAAHGVHAAGAARPAAPRVSDGLGMLVEQAAESFLRLARRAAADRAGLPALREEIGAQA